MRVRRLVPLVVILLICAGLDSRGQDNPTQFRTGVELIQLDVAVLDDEREPVRGLSAGDFTVLVDGVSRPIQAFTSIELGSRAPSNDAIWAKAVAPDVVTNRTGVQEGRLVVILMDRSIPPHEPTVAARRIAAGVVDALGPDDLAAVVSTSNGAVQTLTTDRARLLRAINASDPSTSISKEAEGIWNGVGLTIDPLGDGRCLCGLCVHETITRVAEALQGASRRRKVLFFIGSNFTWQSSRPIAERAEDVGCEVRLKDARTAMLTAVDRANLTVHSIDPQGLSNIGPQTRASTPGGFDRAVRGAQGIRLEQQQSEMAATQTGQQNLRVLPERTGGRTIVNRNMPEEIVPAIFRESEAYYVLGVDSGVPERRDVARSIEVKVARRGVRVHAQRQFLSPAAQRPSQAGAQQTSTRPVIDEAIDRLLPSAALPLSLAVAVFASPDSSKAIVRIHVDAGAFANADGRPTPLDVAIAAVDQTGRLVASARQRSTVALTGTGPRRTAEATVQSHLELPRGEYEVRVAVTDAELGKVASVFSDVTVPSFESDPLSLSDVTVDVAASASSGPVPTTRRVFHRGDRVRALLQIYQGTNRTEPAGAVSMRVQIVDAEGTAVRDQALTFTEAMFANRRADCVITLPVANLPPGKYLLKLDASLDRRTSGRMLAFSVEM